jgi:uncharacterized protein (DUF697 family)
MPKLGGAFSGAKLMYGAVRDVRGSSDQEQHPLLLCGRKEPLDELLRALGAEGANGARAAQLFAVRALSRDDAARLSRASVVVYGGELVGGLDDATRSDLQVIGRTSTRKLALLEALDLPSPAVTAAGRIRGIAPADLLPYRRGHFPASEALHELADRAGPSGPWLASLLPALRPYVIEQVIESAARRNARTSLMIFIPGADLPILTTMQMRMVLKIAACHGQKVSPDRALELLSVLGAGFGFRMIARELLDIVPVAGWAVQSGIAYSGTKALGKAADEYFAHGAVADASRLRALAEGVKVELQERLSKLRG